MNKISIVTLVFSILFFGFSCQNQKSKQAISLPSFNGVWEDVNTDDFKNCYAVYSEVGDSIHIAHYIEFKGQSFFETGSGIIKGDSIIYHVDVIKPIPAWGPDGGTHYLKLSEDKNTLKGIFITDGGHKGSLVFKRK